MADSSKSKSKGITAGPTMDPLVSSVMPGVPSYAQSSIPSALAAFLQGSGLSTATPTPGTDSIGSVLGAAPTSPATAATNGSRPLPPFVVPFAPPTDGPATPTSAAAPPAQGPALTPSGLPSMADPSAITALDPLSVANNPSSPVPPAAPPQPIGNGSGAIGPTIGPTDAQGNPISTSAPSGPPAPPLLGQKVGPPTDAASTGIDASQFPGGIVPPTPPTYNPYPSAPPLQAIPPPPVRDLAAEAGARQRATTLAALVPLLSLIGGGRAAYNLNAGMNPGLIATALQGAQEGNNTRFTNALQAYQLNNEAIQAANAQAQNRYSAAVQKVTEENNLKEKNATLTEDQYQAQIRAAIMGQVAQVKGVGSLLGHLEAMGQGPNADAARLAALQTPGLLEKFGLDPNNPDTLTALSTAAKMYPQLAPQILAISQQKANAATATAGAKTTIANALAPAITQKTVDLTTDTKSKAALRAAQAKAVQQRADAFASAVKSANALRDQNTARVKALVAAGPRVTNSTAAASLVKSMTIQIDKLLQHKTALSSIDRLQAVTDTPSTIAARIQEAKNDDAAIAELTAQRAAVAAKMVTVPKVGQGLPRPKSLTGPQSPATTTPTKIDTRALTADQIAALPPDQKAAAIAQLRARMAGGGQ